MTQRIRKLKRLSPLAIAYFVSVAWLAAAPTRSAEPEVTVFRIDGTTMHGSWIGIQDGKSLSLRTDPDPVAIPLGEIQRLAFHGDRGTSIDHADPPANDQPVVAHPVVHLNDGGLLYASELKGAQTDLELKTDFSANVRVSFDHLAGVRFTSDPQYVLPREQFEQALNNRLPAEDVLISRDPTDAKVLRGRVERLGQDEVAFRFGGKSRTAKFDRLFGVVFATGPAIIQTPPAFVQLTSGSVIGGRIAQADASSLSIDASFGAQLALPLASIASIVLSSDLVVYLSDLPIANEHREGLLHRPWPVRFDENLRGDPIRIGGRNFERGISCHSKTELTYELPEPFAALAATIGLDNFVRPRGSVVYRVTGDGRTLYDSGLITGRDEPQDILVDITGVKTLTLIVDYGEGLDMADHANWGGVRLIRPPSNDTNVQ